MTKTLAEARTWVDELLAKRLPDGIQVFVLPALTSLAAVRDRLPHGSAVLLGAQNADWRPDGALTGEVSMRMVADAGAAMVEIGHSERRQHLGETDQTVAAKMRAAAAQHLIPLLCVGEPLAVRQAGRELNFVCEQVAAALVGLTADQVNEVIIAYEPVWAIGDRGAPATAAQVDPVITAIRKTVARHSGSGAARAILYGGGVHPANLDDLLGQTSADGLFVGRGGWTASGFTALLDRCAPYAAGREAA